MTHEIRLRRVTEDDLPVLYEHQADPEANRMAAFPARARDAFMTHWRKILADPDNLTMSILYDGQVAGSIVSFEQLGQPLVGYWIGRAYWGRGIASRALADFLEHVAVRPLYARVAKHNVASLRVLAKCGFVVCGEDKGLGTEPGTEVEEFILSLGGVEPAIRRADASDVEGVLGCLKAAFDPFRDAYTPEAFRDTVLSAESYLERLAGMSVFVAVSGTGEIVGTIGYGLHARGEGHIRGMAVRPERMGSGVGQRLLDTVEREMRLSGCTRISLDTTAPLERAIRFYERNGYRRSGKVADFFRMPLHEFVKVLE